MTTKGKLVQTPYDSLTYAIIGSTMAVHRKLGPGHKEAVYQRDLGEHFLHKGLTFEAKKLYEIHDSSKGDSIIGFYMPDIVVEEKVVVEIKALSGLDSNHIAQVIAYLAVTGCPLGLLINFGRRILDHHRILPPKDILDHQVNRQWLYVPDWLKGKDKDD